MHFYVFFLVQRFNYAILMLPDRDFVTARSFTFLSNMSTQQVANAPFEIREERRYTCNRLFRSQDWFSKSHFISELIFKKDATEIKQILRLSRLKEYASH